MKVCEYNIFL